MDPDTAERWERIVARIVAGETAGQQTLYEEFAPGLRQYLRHHLHESQDVEDKLHDTFVAVVSQIREGHVREPARLAGFVHTIARRQAAGYIANAIRRRTEKAEMAGEQHNGIIAPTQEAGLLDRQKMDMAKKALAALGMMDRQILVRFYVEGQPAEQICRELGLTETQFRLRKSRAKERFAALVRKAVKREKLLVAFWVRKQAAAGH